MKSDNRAITVTISSEALKSIRGFHKIFNCVLGNCNAAIWINKFENCFYHIQIFSYGIYPSILGGNPCKGNFAAKYFLVLGGFIEVGMYSNTVVLTPGPPTFSMCFRF